MTYSVNIRLLKMSSNKCILYKRRQEVIGRRARGGRTPGASNRKKNNSTVDEATLSGRIPIAEMLGDYYDDSEDIAGDSQSSDDDSKSLDSNPTEKTRPKHIVKAIASMVYEDSSLK